MAIPQKAPFEEFLSGMRICAGEPPARAAVPLPAAFDRPALYLAWPDTTLSLDAVLRVVCRELEQGGFAADRDIALAVLAIIAVTHDGKHAGADAVEYANRCFAEGQAAELQQYLVFPNWCRPAYDISLGEMRLRPFDPERLLYWAGRGGSSYPVDLRRLAGKAALERPRFETRLLDWDALAAVHGGLLRRQNATTVAQDVVDSYYGAVFDYHMREIAPLLRSGLLVLESGALIRVDADALLAAPLSQRIGLFHWESAGGHRTWAVLSAMSGIHMNFIPPEVLAKCREWLTDDLGFDELDPTRPFDKAIETYCEFLQRAHGHRLSRRRDEAVLHFVIALDLIFGMEGRSADSVASRAALVVHRPLGHSFDEEVRRIKHLYDVRSKYVHEGRSMSEANLDEVERVASQVLWALLASAGLGRVGNLSEWLAHVDFIVAALRAGKSVGEEEFAAIGVIPAGSQRVAPNRVVEDGVLAGNLRPARVVPLE